MMKEKIIILKANNRSGYDYDELGVIIEEWLKSVGIISFIKIREVAA